MRPPVSAYPSASARCRTENQLQLQELIGLARQRLDILNMPFRRDKACIAPPFLDQLASNFGKFNKLGDHSPFEYLP